MATTANYLNKLVEQKNTLADNLATKGVSASHDETLETLVPKVLEISGGSGGGIYPIGEDGYPYGDVIIPEGVTSISSEYGSGDGKRKSCFYANKNVNTVKIPNSMLTFGESAFAYSSLINIVSLESSNVSSLGSKCFYSCTNLKNIFIPKQVTSIGKYAFSSCQALTSVIFEEGSPITVIPEECFFQCYSLTAIEIPSGVTTIASYAFSQCKNMIYVSLPNSITSINTTNDSSARNSFHNCIALEIVDLEQDFNCSISFKSCIALTNAAEMLTKLKDLTGDTAKTITFAKAVYDSLSADDIAVATNKNWTVASYS